MKNHSLVSGLLSLALVACGTATPAENEPIKIGFIGPLTGEAASYGTDVLNGIRLKVDELNASGGVNGKQIQLIAEDGRCTGVDAASAAQKLINVDKVSAILGGQCSGETLGAAPIAEAAGVVLLSAISSSPDVTTAGTFVFRNYPSDALKTKAMAAYFAEQGYKKVAAISENTDFCTGFRDSLIKDLGTGALVFNETVEPGTKDYRTLVTRLKETDFDVFFANGQTTASVAAMMQQLREQGINVQAISHDVAQDKTLIDLGGEAVDGFQAISIRGVDENSAFGQAFVGKNGSAQAALAFAAHGYDALGVLAQAMTAAQAQSVSLRDALAAATYTGVIGSFGFDADGDVTGVPYVLWQVQSGAYVSVKDIPVN